MKKTVVLFAILCLVLTALSPSMLACAEGEGERLHEIVVTLSSALETGGDYPLHADKTYYDLVVEGQNLLSASLVAEEDETAFLRLKLTYDKEEARLRLYVDSTHLTFGMTRSTAKEYDQAEWDQVAGLLTSLDEALPDVDTQEGLTALFDSFAQEINSIPTRSQVIDGWVDAVDRWVGYADELWTDAVNAALLAFDLAPVAIEGYSIEMDPTSYERSLEGLKTYYSPEDWSALLSAHQGMIGYFSSDEDKHHRYEDKPQVIEYWESVVSNATVLLDADVVEWARVIANAKAALRLYLTEDFLKDYDEEGRARVVRIVEQAELELASCTTKEQVAAVVQNCGNTIKESSRKGLSKTSIIAIVLAAVAVVLLIVYFVFKYRSRQKTTRQDGQALLEELTRQVEQAKAQKEQATADHVADSADRHSERSEGSQGYDETKQEASSPDSHSEQSEESQGHSDTTVEAPLSVRHNDATVEAPSTDHEEKQSE